MHIEEFMKYYGQQELLKLQKEEMQHFDPVLHSSKPALFGQDSSDEEGELVVP